jgi:hypothetical protein
MPGSTTGWTKRSADRETKVKKCDAGAASFSDIGARTRDVRLRQTNVEYRLDQTQTFLAAAAAVSPGGTIRNMKVETFSPGLNGLGIWLLAGF